MAEGRGATAGGVSGKRPGCCSVGWRAADHNCRSQAPRATSPTARLQAWINPPRAGSTKARPASGPGPSCLGSDPVAGEGQTRG
eukprot:12083380-Alexandrium_andersonii.AAC.1